MGKLTTNVKSTIKALWYEYLDHPDLSHEVITERVAYLHNKTPYPLKYIHIARLLASMMEISIFRTQVLVDDKPKVCYALVSNGVSAKYFLLILNKIATAIERDVKNKEIKYRQSTIRKPGQRMYSILGSERDILIKRVALHLQKLLADPKRIEAISSKNWLIRKQNIIYYCNNYLTGKNLKIPLRSDYTK